MTVPLTPLSPAEQAAAEALARDWNLRRADGIQRLGAADFADEARAVVAAVKYVIAEEELRLLARLLRREVETESCAEADDSGMKLAASFADDAADTCLRARQSLSRPTSEETDR